MTASSTEFSQLLPRQRAQQEGRMLVKLGSPILVAQLLQVAVVAVDTIMAGRYSAEDLSGVAIGGSIWFPVFLALFGVLSALTPTVAQLHGAGKAARISTQVYQSIWMSLLISPLLIIGVNFFEPLFIAINVDAGIRPISLDYLYAMAFGLPALLLFNVLRFFSDGLSMTRPAVMASVIGLLVNIPLNYLLIYGKWGLPELGGAGCGWASMISFWVMLTYLTLVIWFKKAYQAYGVFKQVKPPHWPTMRTLLTIGIPIGFAHFIESSMFSVIALFLASLGPTSVAAHQIALNVAALVFMAPLSLAMALTIRVGFLLGSKEVANARYCAFYGLVIAAVYAVFSATALYAFRTDIATLYNAQPAVIQMTSTLLIYAAIFQLGDALQVTAAGALRGYKDTRIPMYVMALTFWCFGLPLGYTLGLTNIFGEPLHAEGFWIGLVVGLAATGVLLIWRLGVISRNAEDALARAT